MSFKMILFGIGMLVLAVDGLKEVSNCGQLGPDFIPLMTNSIPTHHWPWHAALYHQVSGTSVAAYECGGTLISSNAILTAAHCVSKNNLPMKTEEVSIALGRLNLNANESSAQYFEVADIILHPNYTSTDYSNDIAIVRLAANASFDNYVQPVCLWNSNRTQLSEVEGKEGTVVGWGKTESGQLSKVLRQALLPVVPSFRCFDSNRIFFQTYMSDKNFCAGLRNGTSACYGDSGGSMTFEDNGIFYIRGIVSVAPSTINLTSQSIMCNSMQYVVFTDVAQYLQWIDVEVTFACEIRVRCDMYNLNYDVAAARATSHVYVLCPIDFESIKSFIRNAESSCITSKHRSTCSVRSITFAHLKILRQLRQTSFLSETCRIEFKTRLYEEKCKITFDEISNSNVTRLSIGMEWETFPDLSDAVQKFGNLEVVILTNSKLKIIDRARLTLFKSIHRLLLDDNEISELNAQIFDYLIGLTDLILSNNSLKEIQSDLFVQLSNLQIIFLNGNQIENLPANIFRNNKHLITIALHDNQINELHRHSFAEARDLKNLFLHKNQLDTIPTDLFRNNVKLKQISMQRNNIGNLHPDLFRYNVELEAVWLNDNKLEVLPSEVFRNNGKLRQIKLNDNRLAELHPDLFENLHDLEFLSVKTNQIETLPEGLFRNNHKLKVISLRNNRIKRIKTDFNNLSDLITLDFVLNDCVNVFCDARTFCNTESLIEMSKKIRRKC